MVMNLRRLWNWVCRREPEPPKEEWPLDEDPMAQEVLLRAYRTGQIVVGTRDDNGVTITCHEIYPK